MPSTAKAAVGWMEGGLQASFAKMVLDADLLDMVAEFLKPAAFEPPPIEPERLEALQDFVAQRKIEGGVKTDF